MPPALKATRLPVVTLAVLAVCAVSATRANPKAAERRAPKPEPASVRVATDADLSTWIATLDRKLASRQTYAESPRLALWEFSREIQSRLISDNQESQLTRHLTALTKHYPADAAILDLTRRTISTLRIGKIAPDISGTDLDGAPLRLRDYRGRVVVLAFSGDWCGICREDFPYERQLQTTYASSPLAILGVDSSRDAGAAQALKARENLHFPSWWDGSGAVNTSGPIASAWNIVGWPATYVLDGQGVIRYVDVRKEDLIAAVRLLIADASESAASLTIRPVR